ncbi:NAD(+) diphosphatase [Lysobacter sp. KIS68-7]|uniref:NAD(+) diphosphatase n=1 Tax=Lysobacter sp. KIS68-7 TaxID=2904252 RepID=UPI001E38B926|nr:NAD(+) diphosphatase [Lysobacter sp. KIS68-7]UHQ20770.1 NAD(+) diphosphatase [Lysobacter sp. KIS68-7]
MTGGASPFAFVDGALDRADHLRDDADALTRLWPSARIVLLDVEGRALADASGALRAPTGAELGGGPGTAIFLGLQGDQAWFAQSAETTSLVSDVRIDLRSAAARWPAFESTLFAQARAMLHWHARHRFCGACGGEMAFVRGGWLGRCAQCGSEHYPRTDQAIIVAVSDGARLLLGRQRSWPARRWSVIAGFVEPGESLEQTVVREVFEETGVRVRSSRYVASQPWAFPGSLMLGFHAEAGPDAPTAGDELEDVRWFDADTIRAGLARDWTAPPGDDEQGIALSAPLSIARWLIETWLATVTR